MQFDFKCLTMSVLYYILDEFKLIRLVLIRCQSYPFWLNKHCSKFKSFHPYQVNPSGIYLICNILKIKFTTFFNLRQFRQKRPKGPQALKDNPQGPLIESEPFELPPAKWTDLGENTSFVPSNHIYNFNLSPASLVRSRIQWREYSRLRSLGLRGEGEGGPEDKAEVIWVWRGGGQVSTMNHVVIFFRCLILLF